MGHRQDSYKDMKDQAEKVFRAGASTLLDLTSRGLEALSTRMGRGPLHLLPAEDPRLVNHKRIDGSEGLVWMGGSIIWSALVLFCELGIMIDSLHALRLSYLFIFTPLALLGLAGGILGFLYGKGLRNKGVRIRRYLRELGSGTAVAVRDLALGAGVSEEVVCKDIYFAIRREIFKEARLVEGEQIFLLDRETYRVYLNQHQGHVLEEDQREVLPRTSEKEEKSLARENFFKDLDLLEKDFHGKDAEKVATIRRLVEAIFRFRDEHPETEESLRRFEDYYLPTLLQLLHRHRELCGAESDVAKQTRKEITEGLDTVILAFRGVLDDLSSRIRTDARADMRVMETMMRQDGLLGRDFGMEKDRG